MNKDNFSALVMAIGVLSLIVGFAVYFNSPELNKAVSDKGRGTTNFVSAIQVVQEGNHDNNDTTTTTIKKAQFSIDKSQFKKALSLTGSQDT